MESYLHDWLSLLLRWAHLIVGIAWIGASFYFNWLENHLQRNHGGDGVEGDLWAVHGGGFYYLKKFRVAPGTLPETLHWFKWEAYATWLSGAALLVVVYYWNAQVYMIDTSKAEIGPSLAVVIGISALVLSWLFYDLLCRSPLGARSLACGLLTGAWFVLLAWFLDQFLGGRAAYIHTGAAIGTIMVANVFRVIIPAQKELVQAVAEHREPEASRGKEALQRSRHNNYLTLPVLFIMISSHYPATYGHGAAWAVLALLSLAGVLVRHYFNVRHRPGFQAWPLLAGLAVLLGLFITGMPPRLESVPAGTDENVTIGAAFAVMQKRCITCHAAEPANSAFNSAPLGVRLDTIEGLRTNAERVYQAAVITRTMPLGNLTGMTEAERHLLARWFEQRQLRQREQ